VTIFIVLWKLAPSAFFVAIGVYCLLLALLPSFREKNWRYGRFQGWGLNPPNSWLTHVGFGKFRTPFDEGNFDERSMVFLYYTFAALFLSVGISGLILTIYRIMS